MIVSNHYRLPEVAYDRALVSRFLEAATPYKGQKREIVLPAVMEYYFDYDPSNITAFTRRFVEVNIETMMVRDTLMILSEFT